MHPKNILFILTDQWPEWVFSFRGADIPTPNIDRLAAEGTVFRNAFTICPLCTPARGTLLTSRWPHQNGVLDNYAVGYSQQPSMPLTEKTWIDEAVRLDYHVGYFGKWHVGPINPEGRGAHRFDPNVEIHRHPYDPQTSDFSYQIAKQRYDKQEREELSKGRAAFWGQVRTSKEEKPPFPVMNNGVQFLEEWAAGDRGKPFFLTVSSAEPHFPHYLPEAYARIAEEIKPTIKLPTNLQDDCVGRPWFHAKAWWPCIDTLVLDEDEWRTVIAYSHVHIMLVDEAIGRVLDSLDQLGLSDTTTVIFTSDHGDMEGAHNRFDKGAYFYEEVWRIPLIIRQPDTASATQEAYVSLIDIGETLFSLINAEATAELPRAGRDLMPLVGTEVNGQNWPEITYGVYNRYNGMSFAVRAIRNERYKYVWNPQDIDEFYDLQTDPHEMKNLAGQAIPAEAELRQELMTWLADIGDDLPSRVEDLPAPGTILATGEPGP